MLSCWIFSISVFLFKLLDPLDLDEALEDELDLELDLSLRRDLDLERESLLLLLLLDLDLLLLSLSLLSKTMSLNILTGDSIVVKISIFIKISIFTFPCFQFAHDDRSTRSHSSTFPVDNTYTEE